MAQHAQLNARLAERLNARLAERLRAASASAAPFLQLLRQRGDGGLDLGDGDIQIFGLIRIISHGTLLSLVAETRRRQGHEC